MRGVVLHGERRLELLEFPDPTPGPGEVVLAIRASGMCGSDLHDFRRPAGPYREPTIAGHEPCGEVVAVGPEVTAPHARVGARMMVHHYHGCAGCEQCRSGWPQMCQAVPVTVYGANAHGAHAPYMKVSADTLVPLDDALSFAAGAAIGCGTGTAWGALERMGLTGRDTVAIFGQGPVGLSATMLARALGARVVALDVDPARLLVAQARGADLTINSRECDPVAAIRDYTAGVGTTMALETSGAPAAGAAAMEAIAPWGTVCLVGVGSEVTVSVARQLRKQVRVLTSWTMSIHAQHACARFVVDRGIDLDALFSDRWQLAEADLAYRTFDRQSGGKGVFLF